AFALELVRGGSYPRSELLDRLQSYGFERDASPGYVVRGDTLEVWLREDDAEDVLHLEFFGDELDVLRRGGVDVETVVLAPRAGAELAEASWSDRLLEHLPGTVFLDSPELYPGEPT